MTALVTQMACGFDVIALLSTHAAFNVLAVWTFVLLSSLECALT